MEVQNSNAATHWISGLKSKHTAHFFALLAIATVFGGGGVRYGIMNAVVQLSALVILAFKPSQAVNFFRHAPTPLRILVALTLLLPLLQLVPLPPLLWNALPGRAVEAQSLALIDQSQHWMTWTTDPARTLVAFIGLLAPFTILATAGDHSSRLHASVFKWITGLGIANIMIGAIQLASGRQLLNWYGGGNPSHLYGTFANHNSAGLFLVIALCSLLGIETGDCPSRRMTKAAFGTLLTSGVFLTQSRSSIALLIIPAIQLLLQYLCAAPRRPLFQGSYMAAISVLAALGALSALAMGNSKAGEILHRFDDLRDARPMIWQDSLVAISRYWPAGSGIGTFDEVFQIDESLENANSHLAGRAHNEYLELLLESGLFGGLLALGWLIYGLRLTRSHAYRIHSHFLAPISAIMAISMQSLLDYPLRNQAIMCTAAAMIALLVAGSERTRHR
ncbi:O-antigen ligase family protein [Sphingobium sp. Sx8-8]|uniref:O-antigen ligase family protein n=1 Tax=Sphingobium sp. Sx8-8 TaxID=2933617 RepID=UPI001F577D0C|nr:O-antigen ligase family protein [Sphingobium sp. Sx8-8]